MQAPPNPAEADRTEAISGLSSVVLITGMSGSGKSVALRALEDAGYFCVDNLPPELLSQLLVLEEQHGARRIAIAMDVRTATSLPRIPGALQELERQGIRVQSIFLDASADTLVRRFSETRRKHPLSGDEPNQRLALTNAIERERELLAEIRLLSEVLDTGLMRPAQLQTDIKMLVQSSASSLTLVFESFGFKRGVPLDADYVFDVRMLPNPHYDPELRPLTGRDEPVAAFLRASVDVARMLAHITDFLNDWLPMLCNDHRAYVTVAIGCTGGQHRSVYLVEALYQQFSNDWACVKRHRDATDAQTQRTLG
jgi:RNase adapter protein RapZ